MKKLPLKLYLTALIIFSCFISKAENFLVASQTEFNSAQNSAVSGDIIEWESGTYANITLNITKNNLTVRAQIAGEVIFNGNSKMNITGDNLIVSGFQFIGGNIGTSNVITIEAENLNINNINIDNYTCYKYLIVDENALNVDISYCNFENRANYADQNILSILVDDTNPGYHKVRHCSFKNFSAYGADIGDAGVEPIRIGVSTQRTFISRSIVEYCYFTQCNGDGEIVSNKARQNVYRYNTFENNPNSEFVLRHGSENIVYGNFFLNGMGGVRIREGKDHFIYNNYFSGLTSRTIYLSDSDGDSAADRLDRITIAFNTFVNSEELRLDRANNNLTTNITLANNIFAQPIDDHFRDATGNELWLGNIVLGSLGITQPSSGITITNPQLTINSEGYYGIASNSPAINGAQSGFTAIPSYTGLVFDNDINLDLMQETRPSTMALKDIGSLEYPHTAIIKPFATEDNTGPLYLMETLSISDYITNSESEISISTFPNPNTKGLNVILKIVNPTQLELSILDLTGKSINTLDSLSLLPGETVIEQDISMLQSGVYLIRAISIDLNTNQKSEETIRFIKN